MKPAISVENLGKSYRLSHESGGKGYRTLRESLAGMVSAPLQRLRSAGNTSASSEEFWALKDVCFDVMPGEVVGIIGRNGAGKSTLLKILSRITKPSHGQVIVRGRVGSLLEVGTGFHPELTGRENIILNGSILGMSRRHITDKFDAIVDFSGVEQFIDVPVKRYSSGMYVRLAFAVAAHLEPEVLVVDEVLAVGDAQFQAKCIGKMGEVARAGRTVLFVSHNMSAIKELCPRIILLRGGRLHSEGSGDNVIAEYLSEASVSSTGDFDLETHPARSSRYSNIVRRLSLRAADGNASSEFLPNTDLHITLHLRSDSAIRDPRVAIAIEDAYARRIFTVASYLGDCKLGELCGSAQVNCCIPRLPLGPGRYLVSVSVADKHQRLLDSVDCAAWFQVGWQNSYGNGERFLPVYGPVLHESIWTKTSSEPQSS